MSMPIAISMSISVPPYLSPRDHLLLHTCLAGVGEFSILQALCSCGSGSFFNHHKLLVLFNLGILVSISLVSQVQRSSVVSDDFLNGDQSPSFLGTHNLWYCSGLVHLYSSVWFSVLIIDLPHGSYLGVLLSNTLHIQAQPR